MPPWMGAAYRVCDTAIALTMLVTALVVSNIGAMPQGLEPFLAVRFSLKNLLLLVGFTIGWRLICIACGLYEWSRIESQRAETVRTLVACMLGGVAAAAFLVTSVSGAFDFTALALFWLGTSLGMPSFRAALRALAAARRKPVRSVLIVGTGPLAAKIASLLRADRETAHHVVGFVDSDPLPAERQIGEPCVARLEELQATLMHCAVDEVVVALPVKSHYAEIQRVVEVCECLGVAVTLPADLFRPSRAAFRFRPSPTLLAVTLADAPEGMWLALKRGVDIVGALVALVLVAPIMLAAAVAIQLTSPGPVLFAQERYGYNRRIFRMYKFRTMVVDAEALQPSLEHLNEAEGPLFKIKQDPRVTRVGRCLRRTSIDELPQLFNVLKGEMSLVGPRPMALRDVRRFSEAWLMRRFSVWPGMTGLWQVRGRARVGYETWAVLDLEYVDGWSLLGDLKILALTVPAVLRGTGAD